jgi:hypothetical protein
MIIHEEDFLMETNIILDAAWEMFLGWNCIVKGSTALLALPMVIGM